MVRACLFFFLVPTVALAAKAPSFDPESARPYFTEGSRPGLAAQAVARFRVEDWAEASKLFGRYLKASPKAADRNQAAFMEAIALSRAGKNEEAARRFDDLAKRYPLLADYHRLYGAKGWLSADQIEKALERARMIDKDSPLLPESRLVRADALRRMKLHAEAEREYQGYLKDYPRSWRESEVRFRVAEAIEARDPKRWPEARELYREVYVRFPTHGWAKEAAARLKAVEGDKGLHLDGKELLTRGLALFDSMRNKESEEAFKDAMASGALDEVERCVAAFHLAQSVFKQRNRPRAAPLFDDAVAICEKAPRRNDTVSDLFTKALYQGARCHGSRGEFEASIALYDRLEKECSKHSYADDARLRAAEMYAEIAEREEEGTSKAAAIGAPGLSKADADKRYEELLASIAERYPDGDQGGEALFRLGFRAFVEKRHDDARKWLELEHKKFPREEGWWEAGRTLYWLGRVAGVQGRSDDARDFYLRCAREYPLAYYTLASLNRLREEWPAEAKKLLEELRKPASTAADLAWEFSARKLFGQPAFQRGLELARLGLGDDARREFASAGIQAPTSRRFEVDGRDQEELLWLASVLYDRAREFEISHHIPRYILTEFSAKWPTGDNRKRWLLSYPHGYGELIVEHARTNGQPPALQFAIVREESAFNPLIESFANAVGLTQLTQPPAKRFAKGLPYSREALKDPVINVTIGARELGHLYRHWKENPALTIASYNAGEGAVKRWLRKQGADADLDVFVESIPYDETRGYTKRVLSSYFAYHWLYESGDPLPELSQKLK